MKDQGHVAFILLGANLGDRQSNILQALQYIQVRANIAKVSSFYETEPLEGSDQPEYLNMACQIETNDGPKELLQFLKWVERRMGRTISEKYAPRPIDIDLLLYDDLIIRESDLWIPHPRMHERAFTLIPLAEIAHDFVHPVLNESIEALAKKIDASTVKKVNRSLKFNLERDIQGGQPSINIGLSKVGITNLNRVIRLGSEDKAALFYANLDFFAYLDPSKAGVHMSRFADVLEGMLEEISLEPTPDIESLAERLALQVVQSQRAKKAEVHIKARYPMERVTPISAKKTEELFTFIGIASANGTTSRRIIGVEAEGMTTCPCAQDMMAAHSRMLLEEAGYSKEEAMNIVSLIPMATHNQRARGTLLVGSNMPVRAEHLVHIVEASMSSETYELLKRPDEFFVVNKAHQNARFAEDVVRHMLFNLVEIYPDLPDETFVLAREESFESIHQHNAFAERSGLLGDLRAELLNKGEAPQSNVTLEEWLNL